ncbi:MAG: hypothetical protein ACREUW_13615 [Burkholderiales bacterium]
MADSADGNDSDALLARADRLLGRHRRAATEVPTLTEELVPTSPPAPAATAGDDIPLLTDVIETAASAAAPLPDPQHVSRAVEQALAGLGTELPPAQREEVRQSLEATLFEQMRKLRTPAGADPAAPPDGDKPPV